MARSARRRSRALPAHLAAEGLRAAGAVLARNPLLVGGATAFVVALSFVSANAVWYQPHFHDGAFFATRPHPYKAPSPSRPGFAGERETTIRLVRPDRGEAPPAPAAAAQPAAPAGAPPAAAAAAPTPDATVKLVQSLLAKLGLYQGPVDGLTGPATRSAIAGYRAKIGLTPGGDIDAALLAELAAQPSTAAVGPLPLPVPRPAAGQQTASAADPLVAKIQAGLKAFGNDGIEVDGVMGERTRSAIREFQSLFGLPLTGEPDKALYAKMKEVGLTD